MISPTTKGPLELEITGSTTSFNRRGLHSERLRRWLNVTEQPVADVRPRHGPLHGPPHQEPQEVAGPPRRLTFSTVYPAPCLVTSKRSINILLNDTNHLCHFHPRLLRPLPRAGVSSHPSQPLPALPHTEGDTEALPEVRGPGRGLVAEQCWHWTPGLPMPSCPHHPEFTSRHTTSSHSSPTRT